MISKTSISSSSLKAVVCVLAVATGIVAVGGVESAYACSLTVHCHAQWYAQWWAWPGITGDREEYGVKSTLDTNSINDDNGENNFIVQSQWIVHPFGKWVEIGVIQGDHPGCPTLAENTEKYYWLSWDGTLSGNEPVIEGECVSMPSVASVTTELSDTNKDGVWLFKVGSTTLATHTNDFGKGFVQIGGESIDSDNTLDGDFTSLQYYDTAWNTWTHHREQIQGTGLDIVECSASSANVGDNPSCP